MLSKVFSFLNDYQNFSKFSPNWKHNKNRCINHFRKSVFTIHKVVQNNLIVRILSTTKHFRPGCCHHAHCAA